MHRYSIRLRIAASFTLVVFASLLPAVALGNETKEVFRKTTSSSWDHLPTTNPNEGNQWGYYIESSLLFYSQSYTAPQSARPIYRCLVNGWDHMLSTQSGCEGTAKEGVIGYLLTSSRSGHVPVYRCRNDQNRGEHFWSTSSGCEGRVTEGLLGYALPSNQVYTRTTMSNNSSQNNDCFGRCGLGCGWMPWEAWTPECRAHDQCVADHNGNQLPCLDGRFLAAAASYVWAGFKSLVKSIGHAIKSFFDWF